MSKFEQTDVEAAESKPPRTGCTSALARRMKRMKRVRLGWNPGLFQTWTYNPDKRFQTGYPLYSSFLNRCPEMQNFRRFGAVRMRLLLARQDEISCLEAELIRVDREEPKEILLATLRGDTNCERKQLLARLESKLEEYDGLLQRTCWALNTADTEKRHTVFTEDWLARDGGVVEDETSYLGYQEEGDLMNIGSRLYRQSRLNQSIERILDSLHDLFNKPTSKQDQLGHCMIQVPGPYLRAIARTLLAICTVAILLVPIVLLNTVHGVVGRFVIIFVASTLFVAGLVIGTRTGIVEILAAGAAYAAVMVVFVSGNGVAGP